MTHSSGRAPYLCFSTTPSQAWGLSGGLDYSEVDEWDLWQFHPDGKDEIHIRPFFGNVIEEVKVYSSIPPDRLWFVGSRHVALFRELPERTS